MKKNIGQLTSEIFALLDGQDKEECIKILTSVSTLLGLNSFSTLTSPLGQGPTLTNFPGIHGNKTITANAKDFFDLKSPTTKGEEFAVAAKYRIDNDLGDTHSKDDLKTIIKAHAKRKFDDKNFHRDIDNAIRWAKFFIKDDGKGQYMLSNIGEKYVDALPDRSIANAVRKETSKGKRIARKKSAKK